MKKKINGIVTIPAGIAQADELQIDSPEFEIVGARLERGDTVNEVNVYLDVIYYWKQGTLDKNIRVNRVFLWDDLNDSQKQMIGEMMGEGWNLLLSIGDHVGATTV